MSEKTWSWDEPLTVLESVDGPYLKTASGTIGVHPVAVHCSSAPETPFEFRVFLDGKLVFEQGMTTPEAGWYQLCQDLGYRAGEHWDLDPALILFHQALPVLTRGWKEPALPLDDLGLPEGVVCLATVQAAWSKAVAGGREDPDGDPDRAAADLVAACFKALPLRAVVFHDDPGQREDHVGTALDDPLLGVFLHLGRSRRRRVTLAKATQNATGGLKWSAWEPGGDWTAEGREFTATQGPAEFLRAGNLGDAVPSGFGELFRAQVDALGRLMDPVLEAYRHAYPAGIVWHRDAGAGFLNRMVVEVRTEAGRPVPVLDDGSEVVVAETRRAHLTRVTGEADH